MQNDDQPHPQFSELTFGQKSILLVGALGPLGFAPASGCVAVAVAGIPLYLLMHAYLPRWGYLAVTVVICLFGVWIHERGDKILGEKDSRKLVIDEIAGWLIAMIAVPAIGVTPSWQLIALGYVLERGIDIAKVPPANWIENRWPGGWGVVGDDIMAGLYTLGILHAVMYLGLL